MAPPNSPPLPNPSSINPTFRSVVRVAPPRQQLDSVLFGTFDTEATAARARVLASEESRRIINGTTLTSSSNIQFPRLQLRSIPTAPTTPTTATAASGSNRVHMSGRRRTLSNGSKQITTKPFPLPKYLLHSTRSDRYSTVPSSTQITLPVSWNPEDAATLLTVSSDGLRVSFNGQGRQTDRDAASVRTCTPISQETPFFYYETEIVSSGQSGYIAVGLSKNSVSLQRLVGWDPDSWGYHGDDGRAFCSKGYGEVFGPTFTRGDVIGCGVDWTGSEAGAVGGEGRVFFVKNGIFIGYAFSGLTGELFPSVGLRTVGEIVKSNFGSEPFKFDIDGFVLGRKQAILASIQSTIVSPPFLIPSSPSSASSSIKQSDRIQSTIQDLIASYLHHHSYSSTAAAFTKQIRDEREEVKAGCFIPHAVPIATTSMEVDVEMNTETKRNAREEIKNALSIGDAALALTLLAMEFPTVLTQDKDDPSGGIRLKLQLRVFIESLSSMRKASQPRGKGKRKQDANELMEDLAMDDSTTSSPSSSSSALDDLLGLGRAIDAEYQNDPRVAVREALQLTFSLLAYDSPEDRGLGGKIGYMFSGKARCDLADEVNSAILVSQSLPARPHLETLYRHAAAAVETLVDEGVGSAALVDIRSEILN